MPKTFIAYIDYFKSLAEKTKAIGHSAAEKHFFRMNIDETLSSARDEFCDPLFILEPYSAGIRDSQADSYFTGRRGAFMILKSADEADFDRQDEVYQETEEIVLDLVRRMRHDARTFPVKDREILKLDIDSITWQPIGPAFDHHFGWLVEFVVENCENLKYDDTKFSS